MDREEWEKKVYFISFPPILISKLLECKKVRQEKERDLVACFEKAIRINSEHDPKYLEMKKRTQKENVVCDPWDDT